MSALFDANEYPSPDDSGRDPRGSRSRGAEWYRIYKNSNSAEPSDGSWVVVADRHGPLDYVHRIDHSASAQLSHGSMATLCDSVGRILHQPPIGTKVLICPVCRERS